MNVAAGVEERYSDGAKSRQADLCCPIDYRPELLTALPQEIIDRDYYLPKALTATTSSASPRVSPVRRLPGVRQPARGDPLRKPEVRS